MKKQKELELTERTNVNLSQKTKERFWAYCEENGYLKSKAIDRILAEYLDNIEKN